jgi:hypothetical protein
MGEYTRTSKIQSVIHPKTVNTPTKTSIKIVCNHASLELHMSCIHVLGITTTAGSVWMSYF